MGLFDWLFGRNAPALTVADTWPLSENGNPTRVIGKHRLTVFDDGRGFKFCIADARRDDRDPYFSSIYETEDQAKHEALAWIGIEASRYQSESDRLDELRRARATAETPAARARIAEFPLRLREIENMIADAKNITDLRKADRKARSLKNATHGEIRNQSDINDEEINTCVEYFNKAADLAEIIEQEISRRKAAK